jgi:hypothetical protein
VFGGGRASLPAFAASMARFVQLGVTDVTISGGDPLLIPDLGACITALRQAGATTVKVDTVGSAWVDASAGRAALSLAELVAAVDVVGIPLDGWSNDSARLFRVGRPRLFDETQSLLNTLDSMPRRASVYVNTVLHRMNARNVHDLWAIVAGHSAVGHWNVFQYTPTDQAAPADNECFRLSDAAFGSARDTLLSSLSGPRRTEIEFASVRDRLGQYLLINSDGQAWLPDGCGRTVGLGPVHGREDAVLAAWADAVQRILDDSNAHPDAGLLSVRSRR